MRTGSTNTPDGFGTQRVELFVTWNNFMTFSIRTIIRALLVPDHRISCPRIFWRNVLNELERRGEGQHESGVFLLGENNRGRLEVKDAIFYDELDPEAYRSGVCVLHGEAFAKLWAICRNRGLTVVADAHTHPGCASQSSQDRTNPMIARSGHVAIIVPRYAKAPVLQSELGVYEYCGEHTWKHPEGKLVTRFFYTGFWS
jgi:proteasome lid subunit RPN8/RPN11